MPRNLRPRRVALAFNACAPGHLCASASDLPECPGSGCCAAFCDLEAPICEVPGTICTPVYEAPQEPYADVGVCLLPMP